jgi:hypothetical protein
LLFVNKNVLLFIKFFVIIFFSISYRELYLHFLEFRMAVGS